MADAKRGGSVHIAVTRRHYEQTEYKTTLLRRSYREGGKVKNETLGNLSHLPDHVIDGLRAMLAGQHPGDSDGRYHAAYRYAQRWGLRPPTDGGIVVVAG